MRRCVAFRVPLRSARGFPERGRPPAQGQGRRVNVNAGASRTGRDGNPGLASGLRAVSVPGKAPPAFTCSATFPLPIPDPAMARSSHVLGHGGCEDDVEACTGPGLVGQGAAVGGGCAGELFVKVLDEGLFDAEDSVGFE